MSMIEIFLWLLAGYGVLGLVVAVAFVIVGVTQVDAAAHGSPVLFRIAILPGTAALWPFMLKKWLRAVRKEGT